MTKFYPIVTQRVLLIIVEVIPFYKWNVIRNSLCVISKYIFYNVPVSTINLFNAIICGGKQEEKGELMLDVIDRNAVYNFGYKMICSNRNFDETVKELNENGGNTFIVSVDPTFVFVNTKLVLHNRDYELCEWFADRVNGSACNVRVELVKI